MDVCGVQLSDGRATAFVVGLVFCSVLLAASAFATWFTGQYRRRDRREALRSDRWRPPDAREEEAEE